MITTYRNKEQPSLQEIVAKRQLDIVFTTTPIQPLLQTYSSGNLLQVIIQKSRHMIPIGDIQILFRPIIKYSSSPGPFASLAQKLMTCVTAVHPRDFIAFQSATVENNQLLSQTNFTLTRTRNLVQNYLNQLENIKKRDTMKSEHYDSGLISSSGVGSANTGFSEISITHPNTNLDTAAGALFASRSEGDAYPRAIIERQIMYNADFTYNVPPTGGFATTANTYFSPSTDENADALLSTEPKINVTGGSLPQQLQTFPLIGLSLTPSVAIYKEQQTRFAHFRQRFITQIVTSYALPTIAAPDYSKTYVVGNQAVSKPIAAQQKMIYGQPVQGIFGGQSGVDPTITGINYQCSSVGNSTARVTGIPLAGNPGVCAPGEQFTNCAVSVAETAVEFNRNLGGIDMMCMDSTQLVLQWNINRPDSCLSAYLQPGLFIASAEAVNNILVNPGGTATPDQCKTFLTCCLLGDTDFVLTDVCLRIPYYTYLDETAYSMVRELTYRPQNYYSLRQQIENINGPGQMFTRLSIGGSSQLAGVFIFFVRNAQQVPNVVQPVFSTTGAISQAQSPNASDCQVNYHGLNPPGTSDLRCCHAFDSYFLTMQDLYIQVNNKRYQVNAIPISNPEFSLYNVVQSNIETAFGKHLNIPFHHFLANRFVAFIAIEPFGASPISDNQLIISANIDFTSRIASSANYKETNLNPANQFSMVAVAVTHQAMVDCSYVKIM